MSTNDEDELEACCFVFLDSSSWIFLDNGTSRFQGHPTSCFIVLWMLHYALQIIWTMIP